MKPMYAAYRQVLGSYLGMLRSQWFGVYPIFLLLILASWLVWPALLLWLCCFMTMHVSWRMQTARGRLLPDYGQVHLAGLATVCGALLALLLVAMRLWPWEGTIAPTGLMVLAGTVGCWTALLPAAGISVMFLLVPVTIVLRWQTSSEVLARWAIELATPWVNWTMAGAAVIFLADIGRRFANLTENDALAQLLSGGIPWNAGTTRNSRARREIERGLVRAVNLDGWRGVLMRVIDAQFDAKLLRGSAGVLWQIRRWLLPYASGKSIAVAMVIAGSVIVWLPSTLPQSRNNPAGFFMPVIMMTVCMSVGMLFQRRQFLAIESLRPVTRGQLFQQLGAGILGQWGMCVLVLLAVLGWMNHRAGDWPGQGRGMAGAVAVVIGMMVIDLAILLWLARFKRMLAGAAAVAVMAAIGSIAVQTILFELSAGWLFFSAAVETAVGGLLLWMTYRRWLVTDLD